MIETDKILDKYISEHTSPEDSLLHEIYRISNICSTQRRMVSGHVQGKILEFFSCMIKPKNILEIGTFTGYSAICLAKGLQQDGELHTIDINDEIVEIARTMIDKSDYAQQIHMHIGDARDIIPSLEMKFDLVFIDGDKRDYILNYQAIFDKVPIGGYVFADNVLWYKKVIEPLQAKDEQTAAIIAFNDFIQNDTRVENVLLPFRDGIMAIRKIAE